MAAVFDDHWQPTQFDCKFFGVKLTHTVENTWQMESLAKPVIKTPALYRQYSRRILIIFLVTFLNGILFEMVH